MFSWGNSKNFTLSRLKKQKLNNPVQCTYFMQFSKYQLQNTNCHSKAVKRGVFTKQFFPAVLLPNTKTQ